MTVMSFAEIVCGNFVLERGLVAVPFLNKVHARIGSARDIGSGLGIAVIARDQSRIPSSAEARKPVKILPGLLVWARGSWIFPMASVRRGVTLCGDGFSNLCDRLQCSMSQVLCPVHSS